MSPPEVISTLYSCQKLTELLCNYRSAQIAFGLVGIRLGTESGEITLIYIVDPQNKVTVFDVYTNPGLVHEGGLADLLRCEHVTKVVQDCQLIGSMVYWRYGIVMRNTFDVKLAYEAVNQRNTIKSVASDMPLPTLEAVCSATGVEYKPDPLVQHTVANRPAFWRLRPLTPAVLQHIAQTAAVLIPLYKKLNSVLTDECRRALNELWRQRVVAKVGKTLPQTVR